MTKQSISIDYFPEGDMLSVTFGKIGRKGSGYELSENIYVRVAPETNEPLGLTLTSYSKLIKLKSIPLSLWDEISVNKQQILLSVLQNYPVNLFLNVEKSANGSNPSGSFPNKPLQELVAA